METVRCKVRLVSVSKHEHSHYVGQYPNGQLHKQLVHDASFSFVTAGDGPDASEENRRFWEATPTGQFSISTVKELPWEIGKEYYVDVSPA